MTQEERLALEFLTRELSTSEIRTYDHLATTFRWLMATLFAANGGAIASMLNNESGITCVDSLWWFAAGIVLSVCMGALSAFGALRYQPVVSDMKGQLHNALITGHLDDAAKALEEFVSKQKQTWKTWLPTYAGIASLVCFVVGLSLAGAALLKQSPTSDASPQPKTGCTIGKQ